MVADRLGLPKEKVITSLHKYGNTSAASIPLALDEAVRSGRVKKGDVIACAGFGAGLSWVGYELGKEERSEAADCLPAPWLRNDKLGESL